MTYKKFSEEEKRRYRKQQLEDVAGRMNKYISEMKDTNKFKEFLNTTSKFHNYSLRNIVLIAQQKPESTYLASYNSWNNKLGRQIKKGAKAIKIVSTITNKKEKNPKVIDYRTQNVFDISDTKGKDLVTARDLIHENLNNSNDYKHLYNEFKNTISNYNDLEIKYNKITNDHNYDEAFRDLIHNYTEYKLENEYSNLQLDNQTKILQKESCNYIISDYYNLDISKYSLDYNSISSFEDKEFIIQYLKDIKDCTSNTIEEINSMTEFERFITSKQYQNITQEEEKSLTKMIDRNLKNGFDKMPIIEGILLEEYDMKKTETGFENEYFEIDIEYNGFDTKNVVDRCDVSIFNKLTTSKTSLNYKQTYSLNNLNNTCQIQITDINNDKIYSYNRDYDGNIKGQNFKDLSDEDQLIKFEKYIEKNIRKNGILGTQSRLLVDIKRMGFEMKTDISESDENEIKLIFNKLNKNENNPFKEKKEVIEISVLKDINNNHHATFKMENKNGIVIKTSEESDEVFHQKADLFKKSLLEKKSQMEI